MEAARPCKTPALAWGFHALNNDTLGPSSCHELDLWFTKSEGLMSWIKRVSTKDKTDDTHFLQKERHRSFNWKVREGYRAPICFLVDGGGYQFHVMSCSAFSAAIRPAVYLSVVVDLWTQEDQKVEVQHRTSHCGLSDLIGWCCGTRSLLICNHRYILKASCVWFIFFCDTNQHL